MAIKVKGETYGDAAELVDAIGRLSAQASDMADGPERLALVEHIEDLDSVLRGYANGEDGTGDPPDNDRRPLRSSGGSPTDGEEDKEDEDALREGATYACPMCEGTGSLYHEPPQDPNRYRCEACQGWGKVYTGSRVEGRMTENCSVCQGDGFRTRTAEQAVIPTPELKAAIVPEQLGAIWNQEHSRWDPPPGQQPPWVGAMWDSFHGKWA